MILSASQDITNNKQATTVITNLYSSITSDNVAASCTELSTDLDLISGS
ncbi:MAG: hypothetical protein M1491_09840 [Deltaproteobacteria bacterium]|nr:hypothetical protein [Deltaproteobacteria bacterium]